MAVTHSNIAGAEPSTVTFRVGTVLIDRGGTNEHQEILVLGSPQTSNALAAVVASPPASTEFGLGVRIISGPSSVADLAVRPVWSSTQADNRATVYQSTAADLNVTVAGYSTIATVSTGSVRVHQSTAADLQATVAQASTAWVTQPSLQPSTVLIGFVGKKQTFATKFTITLTSSGLASGSARQSAVVDNSTSQYSDVAIRIMAKGTAGSSGLVDWYVYTGLNDTSYTDAATGADAAFTAANRRNSRYLGSIQMSTAPSQETGMFFLRDIFPTIPSKWGLIEINNSGGNLSSTNGDNIAEAEGIY